MSAFVPSDPNTCLCSEYVFKQVAGKGLIPVMNEHTRAHTRSRADGRSTCSLRGEWPDRPEPGHSRISAITRASYAILFQLIIRGLFYMPGAASSLISLGPFSTYTADAHLPKCEPLSGEGGGVGLGRHSLCSRLLLGHIVLPILFLQTCSIVSVRLGVKRFLILNINSLLHV